MRELVIRLRQDERKHLEEIREKGYHSSREMKHANILLLSDKGSSPKEISRVLGTTNPTIFRVRKRYMTEGLEGAIKPRPKSGKPRKFTLKDEEMIVEIANSPAPEGHVSWTLSLLAKKIVELRITDSVAKETVRQVLKKKKLNGTISAPGAYRSR